MKKVFLLYIVLLMCSCTTHKEFTSLSGLYSHNFISEKGHQQTHLYVLNNKNGMEVCITNYGARIVSLMAPDKTGKSSDIVCGFDNVKDYHQYRQNFGATVGRYIGRILNARMTIDSVTYHLQSNGGKHCSHGGYPGFADRIWKVKKVKRNSLHLIYISPDGENGFPGTLITNLIFTLTRDNALQIDYEATTDKPTVFNPSNHSFFNLSGDLNKSIENESLQIDGDSIAEYDTQKCVTGKFLSVKSSPFDFTTSKIIGERINENNVQLNVTRGYDHTWRLNVPGNIKHLAAKLTDTVSGRTMEVYTTEPGLHIYTANGLNGKISGKNHIAYPTRSAICFETMHFADSPNKSQFPSTLLRPGNKFHSQTIFKFGIIAH